MAPRGANAAEPVPRRARSGGRRTTEWARPLNQTSRGACDERRSALRAWRRERARADGVPAYVVFHDATLAAIADDPPVDRAALASVPGVGPTKLERYADEVLAIVETGD
jgi:superfamily II DNA helicase RecQ